MLYAVLCYHDETITGSWSAEEEAAVVGRLIDVHEKWGGRFRPVLRLQPSATARRMKGRGRIVMDGPFAETKEQLLGIYTLEAASLEEALEIVTDLSAANETAEYEVRPLLAYVTDAALGPATVING